MIDIGAAIRVLAAGGVEFILVGGAAGVVHGAARLTKDVDLVYRRTQENLARLAATLAPHRPYPRGAPPGLPFVWDERTLQGGLNFTIQTSLGEIDLLGEITAGGKYEDLLPHTIEISAFGVSMRVLDLPTLIRVKRAVGRPKDYEAVAELEAILEERRGGA